MRNGKGVYHFGEKNKIEGIWKNNFPHGEGVLTYDDKKIEGEFRYGKLIKGQNAQEEISSPKKNRKHKKSEENKHKNHKHRHSHDKNKKNKKSKHNEESDKNNDEKEKDKDSNNENKNNLEEIDGIPGICVKKMK